MRGQCLFVLCFVIQVATSSVHASELKAGFGEIAVNIPNGAPLGGYGSDGRRASRVSWRPGKKSILFKPSLGTLDPIRSKALLMDNGSKKLLFVSLDLVGVNASFRKDILRRLKPKGYSEDQLFVGATHTHSGPGAMSKNLFWGAVALDLYQKKVYESVMSATLKSIAQAESRLIQAKITHSSIEIPGIQNNRRGHPDRIDRKAHLIWAQDANGVLLGALANFAIHGIALDDDNSFFSADVPGGIENALKKKMAERNQGKVVSQGTILPDPVVVFMNGAEGDVSPAYFLAEGIAKIGQIFADYAISQVDSAAAMPSDWQVLRSKVHFGSAGMNIHNCVKEFNSKKPNRGLRYFSKDAKVTIAPFFPTRTEISAIKWGGMNLLTWPGEPTAKLGLELKRVAIASGATDAMILGLTNDHLAYFTSPDEFDEGGYESCFSVYGSKGGEKVIQGYRALLAAENKKGGS